MKKFFCPSCRPKIQIPDHLLKLILNLYAFSANAARIKKTNFDEDEVVLLKQKKPTECGRDTFSQSGARIFGARPIMSYLQQRRLLSDWLIVLLVPRFFHARAHEITNKMVAKETGQRCVVRLLALGIFIAAATCTTFFLSE